jgi:hypothetical protein
MNLTNTTTLVNPNTTNNSIFLNLFIPQYTNWLYNLVFQGLIKYNLNP